jgi:hypothetical protein
MTHASGASRSERGLVALLVLFALSPLAATAQQLPIDLPVPLDGVVRYSEQIPLPDQVIGHRIGTRHTRPDQLVAYFQAVAAASDRVALHSHGHTYQGRPLVHAIVTSAANHARLEEIRQQNLRLSDASRQVDDAELAAMPTIAYMGYSVHGNEASGSEAAVLLLYHLAAGDGPAVERVLEDMVVIIDPSLNPDGRARFVDWVNANRGRVATTDPQDREHNEPWPNGRTNHYLFDLNRDWLPAQLVESRGRLELFHAWRPQLHTDFHEMGGNATYFFQPGVPSRDNPNTPERTVRLTGEVARYHARMLDRIGALYYTRESFDDFYYGKGSTYPDVNGAIGILFEQASSRALATETQFGVLSYAYTVRNQLLTSLSTLEAGVAMRETLLRHHRDFYREAADFARRNPVKAYVWSLEPDRTRAQALAEMLRRHRIRVYELNRSFTQDGQRFEAGRAFVVPTDQPQARLIHSAMERVTTFRDSVFYDVSTWTMPLAFGVAHAELRGDPRPLLGREVMDVVFDGGEVRGGRAAYAYVLDWQRYYAPRALLRLQQAGVRAVFLADEFEAVVGGERARFARGAVVVPVVQRDPQGAPAGDELHALVGRIAAEDHVVFHAVDTGLSASGIDLGSRSARVLEMPRVALLSGSGTRANDVGETWYLLNERMGIPVSLLDVDRVERVDLTRYTTIVMAGYNSGLSPAASERLKGWVRAGGVLIALGSSVRWPVASELVDERLKESPRDTARVRYADVGARAGAQVIGGSIFRVELDATHPLATGYGGHVALFRENTLFFHPSRTPGANVGVYAASPLLSGYVSDARLRELAGSAAVIGRRVGQGSVVLMPDNPNFRVFWYGSHGLFLNAVFFGQAF